MSGGPVTVHHCYIHHNEADRGTINTREDDQSSDITVYDCVIVNNVANGHAAGVCVEDGQSRANPTHAKFYGNIIANNRSIKNDGYAGSVYFYQSVDVQFVNNTVVNNFNYYEDNGNWWGNFYLRYNTNAVLANKVSCPTTPTIPPTWARTTRPTSAILEGIGTDINGNPFIKNGKVDKGRHPVQQQDSRLSPGIMNNFFAGRPRTGPSFFLLRLLLGWPGKDMSDLPDLRVANEMGL